MASVPTLLRRFVFVIAIVSVAGTTADLESRITDISRSADLLPSLKLRRTAVALAEAGQGCISARTGRHEGLRYERAYLILQRTLT